MVEVQARAVAGLVRGLGEVAADVGGGHAQTLGVLRGLGYQVVVVGSGPLEESALWHFYGSEGYEYVCGPLVPLPLEDASVDVAVALRLLAHVPNPRAFAAELCRVARRAVVVDYPLEGIANKVGGALSGLKHALERTPHTRPYTSFTHRHVEELFATCGFGNPERAGQFVLPMALHRAIGRLELSQKLEGVLRPLAPRYGSPVIARFERLRR